MRRMNVIVVYDSKEENILFCYRKKDPYKGLYNLVGGKVEAVEDNLEAAYRELEEETAITKKDIELKPIVTFYYYFSDIELQAYVGKINKEVSLIEEVNHLEWLSVNEDFMDMKKFAGEGNIFHIIEQIKIYHHQIFK